MGGGASVLSSEDFVTMSQNLKEEYEVLISSGYTDDEIRSKLMEKYNELFVSSETNLAEAVVTGEVDTQTISVIGTEVGVPEDTTKILPSNESVVSLSGVIVLAPVPETTVQLTEKAKKARKRRGTFENDKVVTASKQAPSSSIVGVIAESSLEE